MILDTIYVLMNIFYYNIYASKQIFQINLKHAKLKYKKKSAIIIHMLKTNNLKKNIKYNVSSSISQSGLYNETFGIIYCLFLVLYTRQRYICYNRLI